ncbi:MAG: T9SS type A sorting domain-containing protein, partial [candidate division WOR-3 bacterium]
IDSITITVIDGASNTKIKTMSTTNNFTGFCFGYNSQHDKLYIGEMMYAGGQFVGGIEVIDCATDSIIKWIFPGSQVRSICYNPMNDKFYASIGSASGSGSGRIEIYSGVNDSLLKTIYLTSFPTPIFYNPVNNKIYCGTNDGVVVIDGNTDNIITTFNKPVPAAFCYNSTRNYLYGSDCYTGGRGKSRLVVIADEMVGVEEKGFKDKDKKGVTLEVRGLGRPKIYCTTGCVSDIDFSLYNIVGQRVYNYYSKGFIGTKVFELDFLPSGVYFAVLSLNNHSEIKKVVIVR